MPQFSIIVPTYNSAKTLQRCLESVVQQSYTDWELCIMDGVSSDNTAEIALKYAGHDNRVKFFSQVDLGIYDAINKGIKKSTGSWLLILGSDDTLYSTEVLQQVSQQLNGYDVVYGNVCSTKFDGPYPGEIKDSEILDKNICHQAIFYKRSVFDTVGLYNLQYPVWADWDHNIKWFFSPKIRHKFINILVANYSDGGFSATRVDHRFNDNKRWNFTRYNKDGLSAMQKLKTIIAEIKASLKAGYYKRAVRIIAEAPYLFT